MTRHRARPSFTVEIKRTRNTPLTPQPDDADRQRAQALWKGTALAEMTAKAESLDAVFAPAPRLAPAPTRPAKAASLERRVLPSLIPAPEVVPDPEPVSDPEPVPAEPVPVPAVRRRAAAPRRRILAVVADAGQEEDADAPPTDEAPEPLAMPALAEADPAAASAAAQRPGRGYAGRTKDALRPGERWKRRLPRVCW